MMKPIVIFLALCLSTTAFGAGIEDFLPDPSTSTIDPIDPTTTTTTTPRVPTTESTTTTTAPPTSTTPSTTTTTPAPTTPTPPTPTPKPEPAKTGNWSWVDPTTKQRCIMVQMAINLAFDYQTADGGLAPAVVAVPTEYQALSGSCNNDSQSLSVITQGVNFTMNFDRTGGKFELSELLFEVGTENLANSDKKPVILTFVNKTFATPLDHSYYCTRPQLIYANESSVVSRVANVTVSHVQLEAFHTKPTYEFSSVRDCDGSDTPDIIPIAVGFALASLVVVVLIAYLVARHRSHARGYMTM